MSESSNSDDSNLVFGAGFAFGVAATMLVVTGIIASGSGAGSPGVVTSVGGALFAGIIGAALYMLSFQENRDRIPIQMDEESEEPAPTTEE